MYRVVYCPADKTAEDAHPLASEWGLPIQHGDSARTEDMDFDRSKIQIISIPVERGFAYNEVEFQINQPIPVKYSNDWESIDGYSFILRPYGMKVGKSSWDVPSMMMDEHRAVMNIAVSFPGKYELVAVKDGVERETMIAIAVGLDGETVE